MQSPTGNPEIVGLDLIAQREQQLQAEYDKNAQVLDDEIQKKKSDFDIQVSTIDTIRTNIIDFLGAEFIQKIEQDNLWKQNNKSSHSELHIYNINFRLYQKWQLLI
jgi:hypothetical protein